MILVGPAGKQQRKKISLSHFGPAKREEKKKGKKKKEERKGKEKEKEERTNKRKRRKKTKKGVLFVLFHSLRFMYFFHYC